VDSPRGARIFDATTTQRMEDARMTDQTLRSWDVDYPEQGEIQAVRNLE